MTTLWNATKLADLEALLTERDLRILENLERFRALSTRLVQRLHYPAGPGGTHASTPTATRLANRTLLRLESRGFIARIDRRVGGAVRGSAATPWHLAATGERFLRARRGDATRRRYVTPSRTFLAHTLDVAGFAASVYEREASGTFDVLELDPEPGCWRQFTGGGGEVVTLKPDLSVVIANRDIEAHAFVEIDRATEHLPTVMRKCRLYQQFWQTGTEQARSGVFPAVLWVTPDSRRADQLRAALRREPGLAVELFMVCAMEAAPDVLAASLTTNHSPKGGSL